MGMFGLMGKPPEEWQKPAKSRQTQISLKQMHGKRMPKPMSANSKCAIRNVI